MWLIFKILYTKQNKYIVSLVSKWLKPRLFFNSFASWVSTRDQECSLSLAQALLGLRVKSHCQRTENKVMIKKWKIFEWGCGVLRPAAGEVSIIVSHQDRDVHSKIKPFGFIKEIRGDWRLLKRVAELIERI